MQLRHIHPRSVEWYDSILEQDGRDFDRLSPEEKLKLRALVAVEQTAMRPPPAQSENGHAARG